MASPFDCACSNGGMNSSTDENLCLKTVQGAKVNKLFVSESHFNIFNLQVKSKKMLKTNSSDLLEYRFFKFCELSMKCTSN
jgi:hypothetical protein